MDDGNQIVKETGYARTNNDSNSVLSQLHSDPSRVFIPIPQQDSSFENCVRMSQIPFQVQVMCNLMQPINYYLKLL